MQRARGASVFVRSKKVGASVADALNIAPSKKLVVTWSDAPQGEAAVLVGSVGIAAIEIAKLQGAISIATTRSATKKEGLVALGADHIIVTDQEDLSERVSAITGGKGARIIFDPIGGLNPGTAAGLTGRGSSTSMCTIISSLPNTSRKALRPSP